MKGDKMKNLLKTRYFLFACLIALVLPGNLIGGLIPSQEITYRVEPLNRPVYSGDISLKYFITARDKTCREAHLSIRTWGSLVLKSESEVDIEFDSTGNSSAVLEVYIPEMDTTGINIDFSGCQVKALFDFSYVTSKDTLKYVNTDMRYNKPIKRYTPEQQDSMSIANATYGVDIRTLGKDIPPEGIGSGRKLTKEEIKRSKKRIREQYPLTDKEYEQIWIADTIFYRHKGETEFQYKMAIPKDSLLAYLQKRRDSIQANTPSYISEYVFDLRKPEDYDMASEIFNELIETDSAGFYRVKDQHTKIKELGRNGIQGWPIHKWPPRSRTEPIPRAPKDTTSKTTSDTESDEDKAFREPETIIFSEDFEGSWPGSILNSKISSIT